MVLIMKSKNIISMIIYLVLIPLIILIGVKLFNDRRYNIISMIIAFVACLPFFIKFEKEKIATRELVIIAAMSAISVVGRIIFAPIPGFKPVTAIVIITGIAFGYQAGFLTGAISAIVSNMFFGQGPWTPFQMFVWGMIGFIAGLVLYNKEKINKVVLIGIGLIGGVFFSLMMDIWTTISFDGVFNIKRYLVYVGSSLPFMLIYAISNVVFLLLLTKPLLEKLNRIKIKYGVFVK